MCGQELRPKKGWQTPQWSKDGGLLVAERRMVAVPSGRQGPSVSVPALIGTAEPPPVALAPGLAGVPSAAQDCGVWLSSEQSAKGSVISCKLIWAHSGAISC
ncbi:unnamed protein product [Ostreobium quekettii]|uniref:Uncharacterized protein n=1 Tax=Ostreobium quekettii TaxID=121088 RepID=A0A8S1IYW9_9CHLO|nr:unnamed protein product [Ostreobium quekettii]